jgi:5'-methylthioadenosine phosphorylase
MAHVTDYDVWHETEETVTVEAVIKVLLANAEVAKQAIQELAPALPEARTCDCQHALRDAIITNRDVIPGELKSELAILVGKYLQ